MAVTEKTVYVSSDGKEFRTRQLAENHDHDILYAEYRRTEDQVEKDFPDDYVKIWDCRQTIREYFEARERYERL